MSQPVSQSVSDTVRSRRYSNTYVRRGGSAATRQTSQESRSRKRRKGIISGFCHVLCQFPFVPSLGEVDGGACEA